VLYKRLLLGCSVHYELDVAFMYRLLRLCACVVGGACRTRVSGVAAKVRVIAVGGEKVRDMNASTRSAMAVGGRISRDGERWHFRRAAPRMKEASPPSAQRVRVAGVMQRSRRSVMLVAYHMFYSVEGKAWR